MLCAVTILINADHLNASWPSYSLICQLELSQLERIKIRIFDNGTSECHLWTAHQRLRRVNSDRWNWNICDWLPIRVALRVTTKLVLCIVSAGSLAATLPRQLTLNSYCCTTSEVVKGEGARRVILSSCQSDVPTCSAITVAVLRALSLDHLLRTRSTYLNSIFCTYSFFEQNQIITSKARFYDL